MTYRYPIGTTGRAAAAAALAVCSLALSPAQAAEDFYRGKQIRIIVGIDPGGTFDTYARMLAKHLGRHIPGEPAFIIQNMPGAASVKVSNYMFNGAPKDGTVIAATHPSIPTARLTNPNAAEFDPTKFAWIGSATKELYLGYLWHSAPVASLEEATRKQALLGGVAVGSFSVDMAILANAYFGTKFKIVNGYKSSPEIQLAVEKEEVHGVMGTAWNALKTSRAAWVQEKKIRMMVQYGLSRHPLFPDVPLYMDFAKDNAQRQAITFMLGNLTHGKPYFAPPDTPADRLAILRKGFDATVKDPEFLKDVQTAGIEIDDPMTGQELTKLVAEEAGTPPAIVEGIKSIIEKYSAAN
jgi:tripartite-type tricarboxylate transporter receptor subunit TctC